MIFSDARWLWALLALLPLALLEWRALRRSASRLERLVGSRAPNTLLAQPAPGRRRAGALCALAALASLIVGAAGPQWGREVVRRAASGSDLVFLVDVSASMDSRDVPPSRLDEARREAIAVLDRVEGSRVGVVAFAGDAVRLCPLTLDRGAARLTLESLTSGSVSEPGTDLARALRMAVRVMPGGRRDEQAIILWTDGEDLEQGARGIIEELARTGIRVFAVGVGTAGGDVVPLLDDQGRATDVKRDEHGVAVRSRLDEDLLRSIAQRTRGAYFSASRPGGELPRLLGAVGGLARGSHGSRLAERPVARFAWFAGLAAALLLFDLARPRRRRERGRAAEAPLHSERGAAAAILVVAGTAALLLAAPRISVAQSAWARGDRALKAGRYGAADSLYTRRLARRAPDEVRVNRATARALRDQAAAGAPSPHPAGGAPEPTPEDELKRLAAGDTRAGRAAGYNLGTLLGGRSENDPALAALRQVLERDPGDQDARWNYELIERRKRESANPRQKPQTPKSEPRPGAKGGAGQPQPQPGPAGTATPPSSPGPPQPGAPAPGMQRSGRMDREQAERLLGALQDLERLEQQRRRQVRAVRERRGKDW
jgi:Ca-activated chloride channel family protein